MLSKNFLLSLFIQATSFSLNIITIAIITHHLSLEEFGFFSLVLSIITVLVIFTTSGTSDFSVKEVSDAKYYGDNLKLAEIGYYSTIISMTSSGLIGLLLILAFYLNIKLNLELVLLIILSVFSLSLISLISSILRGLGLPKLGQTVNIIIFPFLFFLFVYLGIFNDLMFAVKDGQNIILVRSFSGVMALLFSFAIFLNFWPIKFKTVISAKFRSEWLSSSYHFLKIGIFGALHRQAAIFLLALLGSIILVAEYRIVLLGISVFEQISAVGIILLQARFVEGDLLKNAKSFKFQIFQVYGSIFMVSLIGLISFIIVGKELITLAFGEAYVNTYVPIIIVLTGHIVNLLFGPVGIFMTMRGFAHLISRNLMISLFINIVFSSLLIIKYGLIGAAFGFVFGIFIFNVLSTISCIKELKFSTSLICALRRTCFKT